MDCLSKGVSTSPASLSQTRCLCSGYLRLRTALLSYMAVLCPVDPVFLTGTGHKCSLFISTAIHSEFAQSSEARWKEHAITDMGVIWKCLPLNFR